MKTSLKLLEGSLSEYQTVLDARRRFHDAFVTHLDHLEAVTNDLLTAYRQKNAETRQDPVPSYFKKPFRMARPNVEAPSSQNEEVAARAAIIREVTEQLKGQLEALHEGRRRTMSELAGIE